MLTLQPLLFILTLWPPYPITQARTDELKIQNARKVIVHQKPHLPSHGIL